MRSNMCTAPPARLSLLALIGATVALLSACAGSISGEKVLGVVSPYRVDIVQGNVLTKELTARVKPGMSRAQVRDLLGSPLLTDIFHADRWDYVFTIRRQGAAPQKRQVVALFEGDVLKSLDLPNDLPSENEFVSAINTRESRGAAPKLALSAEEIKALPVPAKTATPAAEAIGVQRSYPPLEPKP